MELGLHTREYCESKNRFFDSNFFDRAIGLAHQAGKSRRFDWICQLDCSIENVLQTHCIAYSTKETHTRPHTHTRYHSILQRRRRLGCNHCCCFSPQVSVAHSWTRPSATCIIRWKMAAVRGNDDISPTTATRAVRALAALGLVQRHERSSRGFGPSSMPPTCFDEGSFRVKYASLEKNTELPTDFRVSYSSTLPHTNRFHK